MKKLIATLTCLLSLVATAQTAPPETASAATTLSEIPAEQSLPIRQSLGASVSGKGLGIVYTRSLSTDSQLWLATTYNPKNRLYPDPPTPTPLVAAVDIHEVSRTQITAGIERVARMTDSGWGFIYGLGAGFNRSEFSARYYERLCTFFCGFNPNAFIDKNQTDAYAFLAGKLGVGLFNAKISNATGDFKISVMPTLARTGKLEFIGPDGREIKTPIYGNIFIESLFVF